MRATEPYKIYIQKLGFEQNTLIHQQELFLFRQRFNVLMGDSGLGKTSLLHALSKYPDEERVEEINYDCILSFALLPQQPGYTFPPTRSVGAMLGDIAKAHNSTLSISSYLKDFGFNDKSRILKRFPAQCSGGELQRLALIACYLQEPDIILLDEPTAALDRWNVSLLLDSLRQWMAQKESRTVLCATHDPSVFLDEDIRFIKLENRQLQSVGRPNIDFHADSGLNVESGPLLYRVKGGLFRYNKSSEFPVVLDLSIRQGDSIGITGPSGSGKSTIGRLISSWLQWDTYQELYYGGRRKYGIQYIGQDAASLFHPFRKMGDQLILVWKQWSHIHDCSFDEYLRRFRFQPEMMDRKIYELSGGQRQRAQLARSFMSKPDLMILDENFSGLDDNLKRDLINDIQGLQKSEKTAYVWISHELDLLHQTCEKLLFIDKGSLIKELKINEMEKTLLYSVTNDLVLTSYT